MNFLTEIAMFALAVNPVNPVNRLITLFSYEKNVEN